MVICNIVHLISAKERQPDVYEVDRTDHFDEEWTPPFNPKDVVRIKTHEKFSDSYNLFEILGEGKYGKVYKCQEKNSGLNLAAKCIRLRKDADRVAVEKEVAIMTQMRHKCIAQIYDAFATSSTDIILIMEIIHGGELFDRVVEENYILTEPAVALIVYQLIEAVRYIHENHILHLDLKPENIMCVSHTGNQIKLIDFGLAQYYDGESDLLFMAGTPEFAAPEVIKFEPLNFHTDMWSIGVITYILLSGISPFLGDNTGETYLNVEKGEWEFVEEFDDNGISEEARDFISNLLIMDKNKRLLPSQCLTHSWLVNYREKARNVELLNQPNEGVPLDTNKLRKYVKNKKFRKAVFGVLFINSVTKALQVLQASKSEHGIQYVKNMLNTADKENTAASIFKKIPKRPRNAGVEDAPSTSSGLSTDELHFHAKPKRQNREKENKKEGALLTIPVAGDSSNIESSPSPTPQTSPIPKKKKAVVAITRKDAGDVVEVVKKVKKIRKPKVSAATTSSTEELAKKPKRSSSSKKMESNEDKSAAHDHGEIAVSALQALTTVEIPMSIPEKAAKKPEQPSSTKSFEIGGAKTGQKRPGKSVLQNRKLPFDIEASAAPFQLPVAAFSAKPKKAEEGKVEKSPVSPSTSSLSCDDSLKTPKTSREPSPCTKFGKDKIPIPSSPTLKTSREPSPAPKQKLGEQENSAAGDVEVSFKMSLKPAKEPLTPPESPKTKTTKKEESITPRNDLKIPEITYDKSPGSSRSSSPSPRTPKSSREPSPIGKTSSREPSPAKTTRDELKIPKKSTTSSRSSSPSLTPPESSKTKTTKKEESITLKQVEVTSDESPSTSTNKEKTGVQEKMRSFESRGSSSTEKEEPQKSTSRVGDLLKKLQKNDTPPMTLAISSYSKKKFDSDSEKSDSSSSKILPLTIEKKTVTEKKTTITKKTVTKESTTTEKDSVQNENSNSDSCEINVTLKTTVRDGSFKSSDKTNVAYEVSETTIEKQKLKKKTSDEAQFTNEKTLKKAEKLGIDRKKAENGVEVTNGHLKATDEAQTKATLSTKISNEETCSPKGVIEAKKSQKISFGYNGNEIEFEAEIKQKLVIDEAKSGQEEKPKLKKALKEATPSFGENLDESTKFTAKKKVAFSIDIPNDENEKPNSDNPAVFDIRKLWPEPGSKRLYSEAKRANREPIQERYLRGQRSPNQLSPQQEDEFAFSNLKSQLMKWMTAEETYEGWKEKQRNNVKREVTATGNVKKAMNKWKLMEQQFGN
uniref:Protein kinase domain-containing protein n=1 Tax=Acrobeloides nanus TaxID=290746 RepID=A0A914EK36_9BILA